MKALMTMAAAALLGLSVGGVVYAAETDRPQDPAAQGGGGGQTTQDNEAYTAALKKCDALPADQKGKCVEAAKRKFGQM